MNSALSSASAKRALSSSFSGAYCAWTSTSGIFCTTLHPSGPLPPPPIQEVRDGEDDSRRDDVVGVAEVAVEARVARAERPSRSGEREGPGHRADERQHGVRRQRHLEDAGRNRDERTDDRGDAADENAEVPPALEPPFRA